MSNCETIDLPLLEVESYQVTEVLRSIFHTIVFNRALGSISPRDVDAGLFDLSWVHCGDEAIDRRVESNILRIQSWADRHSGRRAIVSLAFYERVEVAGWFSSHHKHLHWELWRLPISVLLSDAEIQERNALEAEAARAQQKSRLQNALEDCLKSIVEVVATKREHLPPVDSREALTYPFEVTLMPTDSHGTSLLSSASDSLRRILSTSAPPSVLR